MLSVNVRNRKRVPNGFLPRVLNVCYMLVILTNAGIFLCVPQTSVSNTNRMQHAVVRTAFMHNACETVRWPHGTMYIQIRAVVYAV